MVNTKIIKKNTLQFLFKKIESAKAAINNKLEKTTNSLRITLNFINNEKRKLYKKKLPEYVF